MYFASWIFPPLGFAMMGQIFKAIIAFCMCCTVILWIPAAIWAYVSCAEFNAERRNDKLISAMRSSRRSRDYDDDDEEEYRPQQKATKSRQPRNDFDFDN